MDPLTVPTLDRYLAALCDELKAPLARLGAGGEVGLTGDLQGRAITVTIKLLADPTMVLFLSPVGKQLADSRSEAFKTMLLGLNLAPQETFGMAFGLNPADGTLFLRHAIVGDTITYPGFRAAFLRLFAVSSAWLAKLEGLRRP